MVYRPNSVVSIECCRELPAAGSADTGHSRNSWVVSVSQSVSLVSGPLSTVQEIISDDNDDNDDNDDSEDSDDSDSVSRSFNESITRIKCHHTSFRKVERNAKVN